jgi:8-oxo-dGTP pyrophosphatase MutT (NUDIX family)
VCSDYRVVPAAYVLFRRDEEILLQLRHGTGFMDDHWAAAAAGHVEAGESVYQAAVREAAEEVAVTIDPADLTPLCALHRTQNTGLAIDERADYFFECRRWSGEPRRAEPGKSAQLAWFRLDELPEPVVPHELYVFQQLRDGDLASICTFGF